MAALLLAASNLVSRVLGYARDVVLGSYEGSSPAAGAYFAAFQLPDLLNYLLAGGALSIAFLPLYTRARARSEEEARRLLAIVLGSLSVAAIALTGVLWLTADPLIARLYPRFEPEVMGLTAELTRIVLPAQIFFVIGGILNAALLARGQFWAAALAPLLYNLCIIGFGVALHDRIGVHGFAYGVLIGAALGPCAAPLISCLRRRVPLGFRFAPRSGAFLRYLWIAAPLMLGQSLLTVDEYFDRFFGALIGTDVVAWLSYARKLMLVPVAVVGQAIAAAALPTFARLYEAGKIAELNATLLGGVRAGLALGVLLSVPLAVFASPIVVLVYQRGEFVSADSAQVASLLRLMTFAAPSWIAQQILVRAFYARGDTWRPMILGTGMVIAVLPLYALAADRLGAVGLALAGVVAMALNVVVTLALAHRLHGAPAIAPLLSSLGRAFGIALLACACALLACTLLLGPPTWLDPAAPISPSASLITFLVGGFFYGISAAPAALRFGDPPTRQTLERILRRLRRRRAG